MNKLHYKIILLLVIILLTTIGTNNLISGYIYRNEYRNAVEKEITHVGRGVKMQLERILSLGIPIADIYRFDEICQDMAEQNPEISHALVFDVNGRLLFHDGDDPGSFQISRSQYQSVLKSGSEPAQIQVYFEGQRFYGELMPVRNEGNVIEGAVVVAVSNEYISSKANHLVSYSLLQSAAFFLISLILLTTILSRWVTRPLRIITAVMTAASAGNLDVRVSLQSKDEFGLLGQTLNRMLKHIKMLMHTQEKYVMEHEKSRISELLRHAMYSLNSSLNADKVQQLVLEHLHELLSYSRASLWVHEHQQLVMKVAKTNNDGLPGLSANEIQPLCQPFVLHEQRVLSLRHDPLTGYMIAVPLYSRGKWIGIAVIERTGSDFEQSERELVLTYASQVTIAIDNAIMYHKMEKMAVTDELTGVANRRHFFRLAQQELDSAQKRIGNVSAALFDIDHFKQVNDHYGHLTGDEVLRQLAAVIRKALPPEHIMARYGGEEFAFLFIDKDGEEAIQIAEFLRRAISDYVIETKKGSLRLTISLGVTEYRHGDDIESMLQRADEALYLAKQQGRNQVVYKPPA